MSCQTEKKIEETFAGVLIFSNCCNIASVLLLKVEEFELGVLEIRECKRDVARGTSGVKLKGLTDLSKRDRSI